MTTKISSDNIQTATLNTLGGPKIQTITYPGDDTAADPAGGQTITLTGSGFEASASVVINTTAVGVVTVVSSTTITFTTPALSAGSYTLYVINPNGGTAIAVPGIQYSGTPTWSTAAGSLGNVYEAAAINNTLVATGDAPITYSLFSGTLPLTSTLNSSTGVLSGTADATASPTTYTFTIRATDAESQDTNRQFSLTINPDVVTWNSPANNITYTSNVNQAISNVTMSATSAAGYGITYTANSLPTGLSISGANITGTPTVVANSSSLITATASTSNRTATRTFNWVVQLGTDPYFNLTTLLLNSEASANAWISDSSTNSFAITVNGDTRPAAFSPYETVYSNQFDGTGDYLTVPTNAALDFGTGDFTVELWWYPTSLAADHGFLGATVGAGYDFVYRTSTGFNIARINVAFDNTFAYTAVVNTWYHVAYSRSGTNLRVFVNGVQIGSTATNSISYGTNGGTAVIGGSTNADRLLAGYMSNMRLVKGTALYTSNFIPSTTPLTAVSGTSLLTCQSNRLIDNSTNNFTLTRNGDVSVRNFGPFVETDLTTGSGYFDGTGDWLTATANSAFALGSGNFTIDGWIYPTASNGMIIDTRNTNGSASGFAVETDSSNQFLIYTDSAKLTAGTAPLNIWTFFAIVRSGSTITVYVNGVSAGSYSSSQNFSDNALVIASNEPKNKSLTGYLSNVRIVKGTAVYTTTFTPPTSPLTAIANTSLLTLQNRFGENNNRFVDTSGINNIITRNGNTTQGTFSPFSQTGWSNYFDGSSTLYFAGTPISTTQTNFTIEAWVYLTADPTFGGGVGQVVVDGGGLAGGSFWGFGLNTSRNIVFRWYDGASGFNCTSTSAVSLNQWAHIAVSVSSNAIKLFINGNLQSTTGTSTLTNRGGNQGNINVGRYATSDALYGYISNARIVTGAGLYSTSFTPSTTPLTTTVPSGTVAFLTAQSNRFVDTSTSNRTPVLAGSTSVQAFSPFVPTTEYSAATVGGSMYFDGTGDYLTVASSTVFGLGTENFTFECWLYPTANPANGPGTIFDARSGVVAEGYVIRAFNDRTIGIYTSTNSYVYSTGTITLNAWNHIALVRTSTSTNGLAFYINGAAAGTVTVSSNLGTSWSPLIGYNRAGSGFEWNGYISNLRLIKGSAFYTSSFSAPVAPLTTVGATLLLNGTNSGIIDYTSKNNLETAGNAQLSYSVKKFGNASMSFDGTGDWLIIPNSQNFVFGFGNWTIELWVRPGATGRQGFVALENAAGTIVPWELGINNGNTFRVLVQTSSGQYIVDGTTSVSTNTWYHVAAVRNGSTVTLYVNGTSEGTPANVSTNALVSETSPIYVGTYNYGFPLTGYIDDLRITKGYARYTSNFTPPTSAFITY